MTALLDPACWAERLTIAADDRCVFDQFAAIVPSADADVWQAHELLNSLSSETSSP